MKIDVTAIKDGLEDLKDAFHGLYAYSDETAVIEFAEQGINALNRILKAVEDEG